MRNLTIVLALLCLACGGDSTAPVAPVKPKLDGTWKATNGDTTYIFTLVTGPPDSVGNPTFSGTGTQRIGGTSRPFTIRGKVTTFVISPIDAKFDGLDVDLASWNAWWVNSNSIAGQLFVLDKLLTFYNLSPTRQ